MPKAWVSELHHSRPIQPGCPEVSAAHHAHPDPHRGLWSACCCPWLRSWSIWPAVSHLAPGRRPPQWIFGGAPGAPTRPVHCCRNHARFQVVPVLPGHFSISPSFWPSLPSLPLPTPSHSLWRLPFSVVTFSLFSLSCKA